MSKAIEVKNVVKHFSNVRALNGVTLSAEEGQVFALLGPNGAGKTTLVRMLSTLLTPDSGEIKVLGLDVVSQAKRIRELIGLAGQYAAVDEFQTGYENVYMTGRLYGLSANEAKSRANQLLVRLGLEDASKRTVKTYSGGMRRRLDLGASLVGHPKVLFLDEPTTGLDPRTRLELWEIIRELVSEGTSILLTTQYLEEADELANQIAVMNDGKIIAQGTSNELKSEMGGDVVELEIAKKTDAGKALEAVAVVAKKSPTAKDEGLSITVPVSDGARSLLAVVQALNDSKVEMTAISLHRPSLDDVFLSLTGEPAQAAPREPIIKKRGK